MGTSSVRHIYVCITITIFYFQYRIGQLYMIARHSHEQSEKGEGVEVVKNEPINDEKHGKGQYTEKRIYLSRYEMSKQNNKISILEKRFNLHILPTYFDKLFLFICSRLPTWIQSMIPNIFYITEKAWNYFPYTVTEYTVSCHLSSQTNSGSGLKF